MIEFNGYLTGSAKKFFINKSRKYTQKLFFSASIILMPVFIYVSYVTRYWLLLGTYGTFIIAILMFCYLPQSKKDLQKIIPKRIYTEEEYIVCIADQYMEHRKIGDAKKVTDYGEFYEIVFPFGKVSDKFICQKSLLIKGSLEVFENLFEVEIIRKTSL